MPDALCLVAAGTFGVNMEMASKVVQCEPWWNLNNKNVDLFILRGLDSVTDFMIQSTRDRKERVSIKIVTLLSRTEDVAPIIPFQFREGIGEVHKRTCPTKHNQDNHKRKRDYANGKVDSILPSLSSISSLSLLR
jgi:hypothetical protein